MTEEESRSTASPITGPYAWWLAGIGISLLGSSTFGFALGWTAAATSGTLAGIVSTAQLLPGLVLVLLGGAVSDRYGPWLTMVISDAAMVTIGVIAGVLILAFGTPPWLLSVIAACVGTANAFYIPASAVVPRLLVAEHQLGRAMAARSIVGQFSSIVAAPLGGIAVVSMGLANLSWFDAATYAAILVVLIVHRRQLATKPAVAHASGDRLLRQAVEGVRLCVRDPLLRPLIIAVAVVAGALLPLLSVLIPLLARAQQWQASAAGAILAAQLLASAVVSGVVIWRGVWMRAGQGMTAGLLIAGLGCAALAVAAMPVAAVLGGALLGLGIGIFTSHVAPAVLGETATSHLARVQAVLLLIQMLPVVFTANILGMAADRVGPAPVTMATAGIIIVTGLALSANRTVRRYTTPRQSAKAP